MDWIVPISEWERNLSALQPATMRDAQSALRDHGCALLRGVFTPTTLDPVRAAFAAQWGHLSPADMLETSKRPGANPVLCVGEQRYEVVPEVTGALANPMLLANPLIASFLASLLGHDMKVSSVTTVVSYPGAKLQHIHSDHPLLFEQDALSTSLPTYGVNVAIPLIDVDQTIGPTAVCLGSHLWPSSRVAMESELVSVDINRGDCLLIDYRTRHAGMANRSAVARPILYVVYGRSWFFDDGNFLSRPSFNMPLESFNALPEAVKPLLSRAYSQQMRARYLTQT